MVCDTKGSLGRLFAGIKKLFAVQRPLDGTHLNGSSRPLSSEFQPETQLPGTIAAVFRTLHALHLAK
jgi:hypothetical protein